MSGTMDAAEGIAAPPASSSLQAGDLLGRYQLLCPIARGGMGQVWAARQSGPLGLPKLVAIKTAIPLESTAYAQVQEFLFDEAQVAASVDHPNVCKILELGQEREVLFIAMEWLHGAPLSTLVSKLPQRRLDFRMAAHLLAQACSGLHAAHELRDDDGVLLEVVHRDATPHNFLITAAGELKVMDFGIVKSKNQQHQATQTGELKGKLSYLSPEQIRGQVIDRRADLFTLGSVLYVITVGQSAFNPTNTQDPGQTIMRILEGDYAAPSSIVPDYPPKLEAIVKRALATRRDDRFQTAEEMRIALDDFLADGSRSVTREEVSALLHQCCGSLIEQRKAEIRTAQKLFDSQGGTARSGTFPASVGYDSAGRIAEIITPAAAPPNLPAPSGERTLASESNQPQRAPKRNWAPIIGATAIVAAGLTAVWFLEPRAPAEGSPRAADTSAEARTREAPRVVAASPDANSHAAEQKALVAKDGASPDGNAPSSASGSPAVEPAARPRAQHKAITGRALAKAAEPAATTTSSGPSAEPHPAADSSAFSQSVSRKPARHAIDESDPFGK